MAETVSPPPAAERIAPCGLMRIDTPLNAESFKRFRPSAAAFADRMMPAGAAASSSDGVLQGAAA